MRLKRNLIANYLGNAWTAFFGLAFIPLFIRHMGVEAYGLIGVFAMLQVFMGLLDMSISATINREMARYTSGALDRRSCGDLIRSMEVTSIVIMGLVTAVFWLASPWLASNWLQSSIFPNELIADCIFIMGLILSLRVLEGLYRGILLGLQHQVLFNALNAFVVTFRWGGAAAVIVWWSPSIETYFYWQLLPSITSIGIMSFATYHMLDMKYNGNTASLNSIKTVRNFSGGVFTIMLLHLLLTQSDKVFLAKLISLKDFGYYSLAVAIAALGNVLAAPVGQAIFPRFSEGIQNQQSIVQLYHLSSQLITVLVAPALLLLSLYPEHILYVWSGDPDVAAQAAPFLSVLAISALFNALLTVPYYYQLSIGWTSLSIKTSIIALVFYVPSLFVVVPKYGALGAAYLSAFLFFSIFAFSIPYMHSRVLKKEMVRWYLYDNAIPAIGAWTTLWLLQLMAPAVHQGRISGLIFLLTAGLAALTVALILGGDIRKHFIELLRRMRRRGRDCD